MDALELNERISLAIRIGESHYREFKSALQGQPEAKLPRSTKDISQDIARTLVAFANSDGGELLVGVEDDGMVTGVPHAPNDIERMLAAVSTHVHTETPLPSPRTALITYQNKSILYFSVPKGTAFVHLTSDGRCLRRLDRDSVPDSSEQIIGQRLEDLSRRWDRTPVPSATLSDLDLTLVEEISNQVAVGVSVEKCLQYLELAEFTPQGLRLTNAALVLFAKDVRRWHPRCQIRLLTYDGPEARSGTAFNVVKDDVVAGNLLTLIDAAWDRFQIALTTSTRLTSQARFKHEYLYPQIACRETLINAIAHRNYAIDGRGIEIKIFPDRLEVDSPGKLLTTISLQDIIALKGAHESRNPLICRVLREVGFMREMGEGVRRIFDVMRSNALAEPAFDSDASTFTVTLYHKSLYDPAVKNWLTQFDELKPSEAQRAVLALGANGREFSTQDIIDRLGIVNVDDLREHLTPLRQNAVLHRIKSHQAAYSEARRKGIPKREVPVWLVKAPLSTETSQGEQIDSDPPVDENESETAMLFIANLPYDATKRRIMETVGSAVTVLSLQVPRPNYPGQKNRGYAFAEVQADDGSDAIIGKLDGIMLDGNRLHVTRRKQ